MIRSIMIRSIRYVFLTLLLCSSVLTSSALAQSWQSLVNPAPTSAMIPLLLTDGTVMVGDGVHQGNWWKLTPDAFGNYVNGTWTQLASMPAGYAPTFFGSAVLADGRVVVMGGEYNFGVIVDTNLGAIYDPTTNVWTPLQ